MRYQVPQFVDIEDQIIGPLTLKQFLIYVVGVMVLIPVYLFSDLSLFLVIAIPVAGVAAAFAHWKINGRSLAATIASGIQFYTGGQLYIWRRTTTLQLLKLQDRQWEELMIARQTSRDERSSLAMLARGLETEGNISKTDEADPLLAAPA